ncbi:MAG TPA: PKD domain-containing protein, partial [bacterium]|nr:PKD domain-containing protein [bacterium]
SIDYAAASAGSGRIVLDARTSSVDTPATIVAYDWVFDYTGNPGDFSTANISTTSPLFVGTPTYTTAGTHTLALRVTDSMARTDIVTTSITVKPLRDPFGSPDLITTIASNVTPMTFGVNSQDWSDGTAANPVGGSNFLQLGSNLYVVFYGKVGTNSEGLYFTRSTDNGATWQATPTLLAAKNVATFPQYGGAALTGARDGAGKDRLYVALGTISFAASGTGDILVFSHPDGGNTTSQPWSQTNVRSYALSATRSCACSPAIAVNPRNVNELHLVYGTDTGGTGVGINRRLEIKASTNGVAGLAADTAEAIDAATGPDSSWLTDTGTIYAVELAQHPVSEDIYLMLGANRNTYVLRSTNHGASYTKPLSSYNHGGPFFRDGDMVLDKWLPGEYYVARARRGTSTSIANNAVIHVLKGSNT